MLCVEDDKCNLIGVIEDNLRLSLADKAHRVALSVRLIIRVNNISTK